MKFKHLRQTAAGLLAALLLFQGSVLPAHAAGWPSWFSRPTQQTAALQAAASYENVQLQSGTAVIPAGADETAVKQALFDALVVDKEGIDPQSLKWEYECEGTSKTGLAKHTAWGSINGFESQTGDWIKVTYTHPALAANGDGNYQVRLAGNTAEVTLTKTAKLSSSINLKPLEEGASYNVALPYTENATVDYEALRENIFNAVVASTDPQLSVRDVTIEYYAENVVFGKPGGTYAWMPLEGGKSDVREFPPISTGEQKIRISYAGADTIYGTSAETMVTIAERPEAPYTLKETPDAVTLAVDENLTVDYDALHDAIFRAVVASSEVIEAEEVTIEYYYNGITELDSKWLPLEGEPVVGSVGYPAISVGEQKVRISWPGNQQYVPTTIEATITVKDREQAPYELKETPDAVTLAVDENLTVDYAALHDAIFCAVVASSEVIEAEEVTIEYYYNGITELDSKWLPLEGESVVGSVGYPAISVGEQKIRISWPGNQQYVPTTIEATITVKDREQAPYELKETPDTVTLAVDENLTVDYDALHDAIFRAVVASSEVIKADNVTIEYYYNGITGVDSKWLPLEGESVVGSAGWPAISAGAQKVRISWPGNQQYVPTTIEATITVKDREQAPYELKGTPDAVTLAVKEDLSVDYDALKTAIFDAVVASSEVIKADNVTIEYYYNGITGVDSKWLPLEGQAVVGSAGWPAISAGAQKVRISWPGNQQYAPTTIEATVLIKDREQVQFHLNDGPYEVGMKFTDDQGYDYDATAAAIYNAVVASTANPEGLTASDVTVEYNVDKTGITDTFKPLNETDLTGLVKFGTGDWEICISWPGNQTYRGNSVTVNVTTTDSRTPSSVVLNQGVSFTYNMDPNVMKQAIFDNVIDWASSTLPDKAALDLDDFVIEYKAKLTDAETGLNANLDDIKNLINKIPSIDKLPGYNEIVNGDALTQWVPLEGKVYEVMGQVLGKFPAIGAGENQQIRISYKGNADYRPSETTEGTVTVNKAKVSVKVNSTNIYVNEALPAGFITTDPADKFDLYTIYAGITSNVTTGLYLDLPARYTDNSLLLKAIDGVLEGLGQKTLTQMMNDGVTVGELRNLFNTQGVLDALKALGIDTGTFGQILEVINKLPGILDSVRISFGTPNRAGLYTVAAVTDNKNYETGVGIGFLLVKMRLSGSKLTWNQDIPGGKLTAEQAKTFDFGATLSFDGDPSISQSGVKYLYSGFTSKWRPYSSTTTPPTEPGRYVVTVCIIGGDYLAAPITRSFQITK